MTNEWVMAIGATLCLSIGLIGLRGWLRSGRPFLDPKNAHAGRTTWAGLLLVGCAMVLQIIFHYA